MLLQWLLDYNFSVAVWVGYIALFGIAVETVMVMVCKGIFIPLQTSKKPSSKGLVKRLRPKVTTVVAVLASLAPIFWESGVGLR